VANTRYCRKRIRIFRASSFGRCVRRGLPHQGFAVVLKTRSYAQPLVIGRSPFRADTFYSVPLQWTGDLSEMPHFNAIQKCKMSDYDDPKWYPNIAYVQFTSDMDRILDNAEKLKLQRSMIDLPELVIRWLEYVWAVGQAGNPLANSKGLPSAVFAETIFGIDGIELTPGLATASSCPRRYGRRQMVEAYYDESSKVSVTSQATPMVPTGCFFMRQESASVYTEHEAASNPRRGHQRLNQKIAA